MYPTPNKLFKSNQLAIVWKEPYLVPGKNFKPAYYNTSYEPEYYEYALLGK